LLVGVDYLLFFFRLGGQAPPTKKGYSSKLFDGTAGYLILSFS